MRLHRLWRMWPRSVQRWGLRLLVLSVIATVYFIISVARTEDHERSDYIDQKRNQRLEKYGSNVNPTHKHRDSTAKPIIPPKNTSKLKVVDNPSPPKSADSHLPIAPPKPNLGDIKGLILASNASHEDWPKYRDTLTGIQKTLFQFERPPDSKYNLNATLSDSISLDRMVPDTRPNECLKMQYNIDDLPKASVIIPFYFESLSMLLRTVHSILNRSPPKLLADIILVDDANEEEYLRNPLWDYLIHLPKVRLIRHDVREGLIRSRMQGARAATGDVIIFLDSHTEANINWLEEILSQIKRDPHVVVQPFVDDIDAHTIEYSITAGNNIGIMSWDLNYRWIKLGEHETRRIKSPMDPIYTPSLVGCAIAVQRDYFFHIGAFDEGMDIWGGENIELSLRNWLCGGKTLTLPCSRVAHAFKEFTYGFGKLGKDTVLQKNLIRIAEAFMDDHKKYFYATTRTHKTKRDVKLSDAEWASLEKRKTLRKDLSCKPFEWFVNNIIPNLPLPPMDAVFYGEITSQASSLCWVPKQANDGLVYIAMTNQCYFHKMIPENYFKITQSGRLMFGELCVKVKMPSPFLVLTKCELESDIYEQGLWSLMQGWSAEIGKVQVQTYMDKQLYTFCMEQVTNILEPYKGEQIPQVGRCQQDNRFQEWRFTYKIDFETHTNYNGTI